jgi:hypothetical protein
MNQPDPVRGHVSSKTKDRFERKGESIYKDQYHRQKIPSKGQGLSLTDICEANTKVAPGCGGNFFDRKIGEGIGKIK